MKRSPPRGERPGRERFEGRRTELLLWAIAERSRTRPGEDRLRFSLARSGPVELIVYDVAGRRARQLVAVQGRRVASMLSRFRVIDDRLSVYDAAGRLVTRLLDGVGSPLGGTIVWGGTDSRGWRVSPGTYFVRMQLGGRSETRTVVKLQ